MREHTNKLEVCTADYCSRKNGMPGFIQERLLIVKRARLKAKLEESQDPLLAARKNLLKARLAKI